MNYSCPNHQINGRCEKLDEPCHPVQEGCVLEGKVKVVGKEEQTEENDADGLVNWTSTKVFRSHITNE
jgi:hypothetical protein